MLLATVFAGPLSYAICQTGTITAGAGVPAAILACNAALGVCMAGCVAAGCTPIP